MKYQTENSNILLKCEYNKLKRVEGNEKVKMRMISKLKTIRM